MPVSHVFLRAKREFGVNAADRQRTFPGGGKGISEPRANMFVNWSTVNGISVDGMKIPVNVK